MSETLPNSNDQLLRDAAYAEADAFTLPDNWKDGRVRLNGIAIDSPTTRDRDDAIWLEQNSDDTYRLTVAIADVASFLPQLPDSMAYAQERGETKYLRTSNIPMFPPRISEDVLSLHPSTLKPVFAVNMDVDPTGSVESVWLNHGRMWGESMTYAKVNWLVANPDKGNDDTMLEYFRFATRLMEARQERGALAIYDTNQGVMTNADGEIVKFAPGSTRAAQLIVQEFMILANIAVAEFMAHENIPGLYRNHAIRSDARMKDLERLKQGEFDVDNLGLIYERARYSTQLTGHAALNLDAYTHFTSPLRRFADVVNHAQLRAFLQDRRYPFDRKQLSAIAEHLNNVQDANRQPSLRDRVVKNAQKSDAPAPTDKQGESQHPPKPPKMPLLKLLGTYSSGTDFEEAIMSKVDQKVTTGLITAGEIGQLVANFYNTIPAGIGERLIKLLVQDPALATASLHAAFQTPRLREFRQSASGNRGTVEIVDWEGIIVRASAKGAGDRKSAMQRSAVHLIAQLCEVELPAEEQAHQKSIKETIPVPEDPPLPEIPVRLVPRANTKSCLHDHLRAHSEEKPRYSTEQLKDDLPPFEATITFMLDGVEHSFKGRGMNSKAAQDMAAMSAIEGIGIVKQLYDEDARRTFVPKPQTDPRHYIEIYCAKRNIKPPRYDSRAKQGGYHQGIYTIVLLNGEQRTVRANGATIQQARKRAAERLAESGFIFIPEEPGQD